MLKKTENIRWYMYYGHREALKTLTEIAFG